MPHYQGARAVYWLDSAEHLPMLPEPVEPISDQEAATRSAELNAESVAAVLAALTT